MELGDALAILTAASPVEKEREELETLKVERQEFSKVRSLPGRGLRICVTC